MRMVTAVLGGWLVLTIAGTLYVFGQSAKPVLEFEVASIKTAAPGDCLAAEPLRPMIGRLEIRCSSIRSLVSAAYGGFANVHPLKVLGGPSWVDTDRFAILAKAPYRASILEMCGPMLKALLEERFELRAHQEARETPVYELRQSKGGAKLRPSAPGSCTELDFDNFRVEPGKHGNTCGMGYEIKGDVVTAVWNGVTMTEFANRMLDRYVDRDVIDKTGLAQRFDIRLVFANPRLAAMPGLAAPEGKAELPGSPVDPSLFDALHDQLGLELVRARAPLDVIVIDHVSRPSAN